MAKYIPFVFGVVCLGLGLAGVGNALFVGVIGLTIMYLLFGIKK